MITGLQIKMARAALGWNVRELAANAQVNPNTISRVENGEAALSTTLEKIRTTCEQAGVTFTADGCVCPPSQERGDDN